MLPYFSRIIYKRYLLVVAYVLLFIITTSSKSYSQSLGDPIVHITFGAGINQFGGALRPDSGSTTYSYVAATPDDNSYTIASTTGGLNNGWGLTTDHTGDPNGYMMIVNASYTPGEFYRRKVPGLCGNTTYQFSAFIKNIIKIQGPILPNVSFSIESLDGAPLGSGSTGNISQLGVWTNYTFTFTTTSDGEAVIIKMVNNAPGGLGNDIAIDDIVFRPYGAPVRVTSDEANSAFCEGTSNPVTIKSTTLLPAGNSQKVQIYKNRNWVDQTPPSTATSFTVMSPPEPGTYSYRLVTSSLANINTPSCVVASNAFEVKVLALPTADFLVAKATCQSEPILFTDQSTAGDSEVGSWLWEFGDGQTSTEQNPLHIYNAPGDYPVKLTVRNKLGCTPTNTAKVVHVFKSIDMAFSYSTPDCVTKAVTITDASVSTDGFVLARVWDFGDGSPTETHNAMAPFQHTYATAGSYQLKLTINTDRGCTSVLSRTIVINPLPVVDFTLPPTCADGSYAKFTDNTKIADNSNLTYLWDFGDPGSGTLNTSTQKNPQHIFLKAQLYQVTLTVTSASGCVGSVTKPVMINGSNPEADFDVLNEASLCSGRNTYFRNKASVFPGSITRIDWYYDADNTSIPPEVDNNPSPGKLYYHFYPQFSSQPKKTFRVVMYAYSGETCMKPKEVTITVYGAASLTFNGPDSLCINNGPTQLAAKEISGIAGNGTYKGTAVSTSGLFDPLAAGVGTHTISYIYTAATACADTVTRVIVVKPIPTVDAGKDMVVLAGGVTRMNASATGDSLKYQWSPAIGLSSTTILDPVITVTKDVTYTLTVTNNKGCSVSDNVNIKALLDPVVPNTFTPNNDGINDKWDIKYLDSFSGCTVDVFNRNGLKVFSSIGYKTPWAGQSNTGDLPFGVYYYIIDLKNGRKPVSGYVTIIR
ncbi:PKD domain-containing protein [Mucilaginibacter sp. UYCu711]|uniref:PKD domain-containing protein n=1 Tax=Mucilaginibacter sp. UYCu711 TaxID=3156339 RepID=UPI003D1F12C4